MNKSFLQALALNILIIGIIISVSQIATAVGPAAATPPPAPAAGQTGTLQAPTDPNTENPTNSAFRLSVCDGPTIPASQSEVLAKFEADLGHKYVPCDFNAVILIIQHLINIMLTLGVLVAIVMFSYAGLLYISGEKGKIDHAKSIFPKVFTGFIIMLSAWFIVYQVLSWLTDNEGFKTLLGKSS